MIVTTGTLLRSSWLMLSGFITAVGVHALVTPAVRSCGKSLGLSQQVRFSFQQSRPLSTSLAMVLKDKAPPDFTVVGDDGDDNDVGEDNLSSYFQSKKEEEPKEDTAKEKRSMGEKSNKKRVKISKISPRMDGASWLDRNAAFVGEDAVENEGDDFGRGSPERKNRTFRQDFHGTRVFVKGIPEGASWQDLKDHFAVAGTVVFASVSIDPVTGESKGVGLVQFETNEMATNAIRIMRNHPLNGSSLYVREDVQESRGDKEFKNPTPRVRRDSPLPSRWECADDENSSVLTAEEKEEVASLIKARDAARRRKDYNASDQMREQLKMSFGVHIDDRLKQWWVSFDGSHVPQKIQVAKGEGRWGGKQGWRQIPTDSDACVNPDLVNGLLMQRDIARREKDFKTADALLEEARNAPDGDLYLRIHDESRTWRIWTDEPPPRPSRDHRGGTKSAAEQCIDLVREKAPQKEEEIKLLLEKFPGREYPILKKLRKSLEGL